MKLIEIKNNFAKLYYLPKEDSLHLSDFLTINDGNQKILAQVVSSESTSKPDTNCAVLKFSMNVDESNSFTPYSGYIPSLAAQVSKTEQMLLKKMFGKKSASQDSVQIGELCPNSDIKLHLDKSFLNKFVYIQSDRIENTRFIFEKLLQSTTSSLTMDTDGSLRQENVIQFMLGKNFKLPVNFETLNYIYENDLTGITVEQKAIVQDIVLEIQDYIKSENAGFISFSSLLSVVDDIYKTDKSVGIILFRNKLIKYHQAQLFASNENEFDCIFKALKSAKPVNLNLQNAPDAWKKETLNFIINNTTSEFHLFLKAEDEILDKKLIAQLYEKENINPIIASSYNSKYAGVLKGYAKNLILFTPEEIQKNLPVYSSFLSKLTNEEYIISGEQTYYTPLIVIASEELPEENFEEEFSEEPQTQIAQVSTLIEEEDETLSFEPEPTDFEEEIDDTPDIKNIFEESVEAQIAKDVDGIFCSDKNEELEQEQAQSQDVDYDDMFSDEDLDMLDDLNSDSQDNEDDSLSLEVLDEEEDEIIDLDNLNEEISIPAQQEKKEEVLEVKKAAVPNLPVYTTAYDDNLRQDDTIKIAEGNIVYHEKYGRGVVEQIISYGKKTLCSIQFDNIGRRLLDPNLADLKQA